jgi:hypothetical protein
MNFLALTDADVAPESHLPSYFCQTLLPSQRQSLNFMIEIEKRPCSAHLFKELQIDEQAAAVEFPGAHRTNIEHARFFSLYSINGNKYVKRPPQITGVLMLRDLIKVFASLSPF